MLTAIRHIGSMGKGLTKAQMFECDDHNYYVIKFKENIVGPKVLVNELIANRIALLLNLPVPAGNLIFVPAKILDIEPFREGIHFGTVVIPYAFRNPPLNLLKLAVNVNCVPGIYVFDYYLSNYDRHYGNIVLSIRYYGNQIVLIDHSHCFLKPQWRAAELWDLTYFDKTPSSKIYSDLAGLVIGVDPFEEWLTRLELISEEQLAGIVNEIPRQWGLTTKESGVLLYYLINKRLRIRSIIESKRKLFPNWQRKI